MPLTTSPEAIQLPTRSVKAAKASRPALPVLTSLRFFAAAEVVIFHYFRGRISTSTYFWGLTSGGYLAVTFFFILSGFILTYVYWGTEEDSESVNATRFWKARFARIAPGYYLGILLSLPILLYSALIAKVTPFPDLALGLVLTPLFLQAWFIHADKLLNPPGWSLSVECFFYAIFPVLPRLLGRISYKSLLLISFGLVVATWPLLPVETAPPGTIQLPLPLFHLPHFLFGIALGRMYLLNRSLGHVFYKTLFFCSITGLLLLFGLRALLPEWMFSDSFLALPFGSVILGAAGSHSKFGFLSHPFFVLLGEASFAVYILQWPLSFWWDWVVAKELHLKLSMASDFVLLFSFVCLVSIASFRYFESPLRRRILGHTAHKAA
jgi:peptidoglycan/LPS O-acetylase OafA/YrhL